MNSFFIFLVNTSVLFEFIYNKSSILMPNFSGIYIPGSIVIMFPGFRKQVFNLEIPGFS